MSLRLGDVAPNFSATTTEGPIDFYKWLGNSWGVLFSTRRIIHRSARRSWEPWPRSKGNLTNAMSRLSPSALIRWNSPRMDQGHQPNPGLHDEFPDHRGPKPPSGVRL